MALKGTIVNNQGVFSAQFLKTVFLVKLLGFNILFTQNEILKMNHLCFLQALLTAVLSAGGFGEEEEIEYLRGNEKQNYVNMSLCPNK